MVCATQRLILTDDLCVMFILGLFAFFESPSPYPLTLMGRGSLFYFGVRAKGANPKTPELN